MAPHFLSPPGGSSRPRTRRCSLALALTCLASTWACATECVDDGVGQSFCPELESQSESATGEATGETSMSSSEGAEGNNNCPALDVLLTPQVPTIVLLVDQSGSMDNDFGGPTRWEAVVDSLVMGPGSVVGALQSEIRFGLSLYTGDPTTCPALQSVNAQLDAQDELQTLFAANGPAGETPTGESFAMVAADLDADTWPGDKFIVLATDGEPDTCAVPNPDPGSPEADAARQAVVDAAAAAYGDGIRTFVISVGDDIADAHLQAVANAGAGVAAGGSDAEFYKALDQQALVDAFDAIIAGVRECKLDLDTELLPEFAPSCTVTINDVPLDYEGADGWQLDGPLAIELMGSACTQIQAGVVNIEMTCTCEVAP